MSNDKLVIVWTSDNIEVARNMVFMYGGNSKAKGWWEEVTLIVWGPSQKLLMANKELQREMEKLEEQGVTLVGCRACAERYNLVPELEALGLAVDYVGESFTHMIKDDWKVLTF